MLSRLITALHTRNGRHGRYTIHPSDTLEMTFILTREFNQTVTVQLDAYITLRNVGDLLAARQTLPELTESIETAYSKIQHDPVVSFDPRSVSEKPVFQRFTRCKLLILRSLKAHFCIIRTGS
jgi:protein involved in polysaccharide export with SLBB domain